MDKLEGWWKQAIQEGLREKCLSGYPFRFELVYWADVLHSEPLDATVEDPEDELYLSEPYIPIMKPALQKPKSTRQKILDYIEKQIDRLLFNEDFSINFSSVTDYIIEKYFSDLNSYYKKASLKSEKPDRPARADIRDRLKAVLEKHSDKDILLIAHSMGSIIAYDVLQEPTFRVEVHTFITIGSPLGLPVVISKSIAEQKQEFGREAIAQTPECVAKQWINMSDLEDRIAFNYNLQDDYETNSRGIAVTDVVVHNNYRFKDEENHHKSFGYLRTPEMAQAIADFLDEDANQLLVLLRSGANKLRETAQKAKRLIGLDREE